MIKADPKPPSINPNKSPHGRHIPKQGNLCPNFKTKSQPLPEKTIQPVQESPNPPMLFLTSPSSKCDPNSPLTTLCKSPHRSHGPKLGNPCPNSNINPQPKPVKKTHSEKDLQTPPIFPSPPPMTKSDPKPPSINPRESPHGIHVTKQGNP